MQDEKHCNYIEFLVENSDALHESPAGTSEVISNQSIQQTPKFCDTSAEHIMKEQVEQWCQPDDVKVPIPDSFDSSELSDSIKKMSID